MQKLAWTAMPKIALALALIIAQTAAAVSEGPSNSAPRGGAAAPNAADDADQKTVAPATIERSALTGTSISTYRGARAFNASGKPVGHVDAVIVRDMASVDIVLNQGGLFDSGRQTVRKPLSEVETGRSDDGELEIRLDMVGDDIATVGTAIAENPDLAATDVLAERLLGAEVSIAGGARNATIDDLIIDKRGRIRFFVLGVDRGVLGLREHAVVVGPESLEMAQDNGVSLTLGERAFRAAPRLVDERDR